MGWIVALIKRIRGGIITGFCVGVPLFLVGLDSGQSGGRVLETAVQLGCFFGVLWVLYAEWDEVRAQLGLARRALEEHKLVQPGRYERWMGSWFTLFGLFVLSYLGVALVLDPDSRRAGEERLVQIGAFAWFWTLVLYLELVLTFAGLSLLRFRWSLRAILPELRPRLAHVAPWTVALFCLPPLVVAAAGAPEPETVRILGNLTLLALEDAAEEPEVELLVELGPDDSVDELVVPLWLHGAERTRAFPNVTPAEEADLAATWLVTVPASRAESLAELLEQDDENVDSIELNSALKLDANAVTACRRTYSGSWPYDTHADKQPELGLFWTPDLLSGLSRVEPRQPVVVAVIDSGIDGDHPDLEGVLVGPGGDKNGHGTRVAGLIGAIGANQAGIVSPNLGGRFVRLRSYPVFAQKKVGADDVIQAIEAAIDDGAQIINMSFSEQRLAPRSVRLALERAQAEGLLLIAAAGNAGRSAAEVWPAGVDGVLAVGALDRLGRRLPLSNDASAVRYGAWAPGDAMCSTDLNGAYGADTGTSFAAPVVTGLAAAIWASCPSLSASEVRARLSRLDGSSDGVGTSSADFWVFPRIAASCR